MKQLKKIFITVTMTLVWLVMAVMVIPMKSTKGQVVTVVICLLINSVLALSYSFLDGKPASFREWLKR